MNGKPELKNNVKQSRLEKNLSQAMLAKLAEVSRSIISSIETGQFSPTVKLTLLLRIVLNKKLGDLFYF